MSLQDDIFDIEIALEVMDERNGDDSDLTGAFSRVVTAWNEADADVARLQPTVRLLEDLRKFWRAGQ